MDPVTEKLDAFEAAKELLAQNNPKVLRYVAIELRRCLEAVVYQKLLAYRNWIPAGVARTWQPPQAFKALLIVEPDAQDSMTVGVALEREPGEPLMDSFKRLGVDRRPRSAWLKKTWNRLGSFLHADWPFARSSEQSNAEGGRAFFEEVVSALEPFVFNNLTVAMSMVVDFKCSQCGAVVKVGQRSLDLTGRATCLGCNSEFVARKEGPDVMFRLDGPTWVCECKHEIVIPPGELKVGHQFSCGKCGSRFELAEQNWAVRKVDGAGESSETE